MVGIVFSNSFHCNYIHSTRMYITRIKRNSRTLYVVKIIHGSIFQSRQNDGYRSTKCSLMCNQASYSRTVGARVVGHMKKQRSKTAFSWCYFVKDFCLLV